MNEEKSRYKAAIEAILFSMGNSVPLSKIAEVIELTQNETKDLLKEMMIDYNAPERGIRMIELEGSYQLCTKQEYYDELITLAMHPPKPALTDIMMETLSIIAYKQPVTRAEIEKIRGVKSDHAVNKLLEYNLITELGRLDVPGRPCVFGTTEEFLRHFGIDSADSLPDLDPVKLADFEAEAEAEIQI